MNGRFKISKESTTILERVMVELGLEDNRPEALRLALAKGIVATKGKPPETNGSGGGFEVPQGVIAKDQEYLKYKHLIIEQIGHCINDNEVDRHIHLFIEYGLNVMNTEINNLSSLDNYLLYLMEK